MMTNIHHHWTYIIVTRISFFCCLSNLTFFSWIEIVFSSKIGSHMNERETVWWGSETCRESRVWPSFHRQTVLFVWQKRGTKQTETCCCKCVLQCLLVWQCKLRLAHDDVQSSESSWVRKEWKERERKRGNFLTSPSISYLLILSSFSHLLFVKKEVMERGLFPSCMTPEFLQSSRQIFVSQGLLYSQPVIPLILSILSESYLVFTWLLNDTLKKLRVFHRQRHDWQETRTSHTQEKTGRLFEK